MICHNINYSTNKKYLKYNNTNNQSFKVFINVLLKNITIIFIGLFNVFLFSQNFNLDNYKINQTIINDSIINSYSQKDKYKYLTLLPSVSYNVLDQSINVGFSLNSLSNYFQNKHRNKIELAKLNNLLNNKLNDNIDKINIDIITYQNEYDLLKHKINNFNIDIDLHKIALGKYNNSEITTENYLKLKLSFNNKYTSLLSSVYSLNLKYKNLNYKLKKSELTLINPLDSLTIKLNNKYKSIQKTLQR